MSTDGPESQRPESGPDLTKRPPVDPAREQPATPPGPDLVKRRPADSTPTDRTTQQVDPAVAHPVPGAFGPAAGPQFRSAPPAGGPVGHPGPGQYLEGVQTSPPVRSTALAVTALVLSIVGVLSVCWPPLAMALGVGGVVAGCLTRGRVRQGLSGGDGVGLAAMIVGGAAILISVIVGISYIASGAFS